MAGATGGRSSRAKLVRWEQEQVVTSGAKEREVQPWVAQEEEGKCQ